MVKIDFRELKAIGEEIIIADVKCEMSLNPNTFVKYENFLKELMDELNEQYITESSENIWKANENEQITIQTMKGRWFIDEL